MARLPSAEPIDFGPLPGARKKLKNINVSFEHKMAICSRQHRKGCPRGRPGVKWAGSRLGHGLRKCTDFIAYLLNGSKKLIKRDFDTPQR